MTRDEAIKIVHATSRGHVVTDNMAQCLIDTYVGLGMLKLQEEKTFDQKLNEAYGQYVSLTPTHLRQRLASVGLKIVEA